MFWKRARDLQQPAFDLHQIPKMLNPFLIHHEFRQQQRVYRPADDRGLEEGAGNQTNNGMAVIERLEIVVLRLRADGIPSVQHRVAESLERHTLPFLSTFWMWPHENARISQAFIRTAPDGFDPPLH